MSVYVYIPTRVRFSLPLLTGGAERCDENGTRLLFCSSLGLSHVFEKQYVLRMRDLCKTAVSQELSTIIFEKHPSPPFLFALDFSQAECFGVLQMSRSKAIAYTGITERLGKAL